MPHQWVSSPAIEWLEEQFEEHHAAWEARTSRPPGAGCVREMFEVIWDHENVEIPDWMWAQNSMRAYFTPLDSEGKEGSEEAA